jgi:hypothetical protein
MDPDNELEDQTTGQPSPDDAEVVIPPTLEADDHDEDGGTDDAEPKQGDPPRPTRKDRQARRRSEIAERADAAARAESARQIAELTRQVAELSRGTAAATQGMVQAVNQLGRKPEADPIAEANARIEEAARAMRDDDPESVKKWMRVTREENERIAVLRAREIAREEIQRFQQAQPRPVPPAEQAYFGAAPWLSDPEMKQAVILEKRRLSKGRNMNDPTVDDKTVWEAIAEVGARWGLPVSRAAPVAARPNPNVNGARGNGAAAGGGGGAPAFTPFMRQMADRDPVYGKVPEAQRYTKYYREVVAPELKR